jgi:hypothetical protein
VIRPLIPDDVPGGVLTDEHPRISGGFRPPGIQEIVFVAFEAIDIGLKAEKMIERSIFEHQHDDVFDICHRFVRFS